MKASSKNLALAALTAAALTLSASAFAGNGLGPSGSVCTGTGPYSLAPASVTAYSANKLRSANTQAQWAQAQSVSQPVYVQNPDGSASFASK